VRDDELRHPDDDRAARDGDPGHRQVAEPAGPVDVRLEQAEE
jgi:hypothetical protein